MHNEADNAERAQHDEGCLHDTTPYLGAPAQAPTGIVDSLFEHYERRSLRTIIQQQQAYRESQAAQAARVILDGAQIPEFDPVQDQAIQFDDHEDDGKRGGGLRQIRVQRAYGMGRLVSPGAQIVYVLLTIAVLSGTLGLAFSTDSPQLLLLAGIATPMLLPICVWRWCCWLDSAPYYYRLLTTLGEDARNLLDYRLFGRKTNRA